MKPSRLRAASLAETSRARRARLSRGCSSSARRAWGPSTGSACPTRSRPRAHLGVARAPRRKKLSLLDDRRRQRSANERAMIQAPGLMSPAMSQRVACCWSRYARKVMATAIPTPIDVSCRCGAAEHQRYVHRRRPHRRTIRGERLQDRVRCDLAVAPGAADQDQAPGGSQPVAPTCSTSAAITPNRSSRASLTPCAFSSS